MNELYLALSIFLLAHVIPSYKPLRAKLVDRMGERPFMSVYGLFSLALFIWLIKAYLAAPYIELWLVHEGMRHTNFLLMFFVCLLLTSAFASPNPFSLGRGAQGFDPAAPGIVSLTKHPAFWGFALWAVAHLLVNGDVASCLFFGTMLLLSLYGPKSLNEKRKVQMGPEAWADLDRQVKRGLPRLNWKIWVITVVVYLGIFHSHEYVIGVAPYSW